MSLNAPNNRIVYLKYPGIGDTDEEISVKLLKQSVQGFHKSHIQIQVYSAMGIEDLKSQGICTKTRV